MTIIAVFRSRNQAMDYGRRLKNFYVPSDISTAPKEANIGCGLAVKFDSAYIQKAKSVIRLGGYSEFRGFFVRDYRNGSGAFVPYFK